MFSFLTRTKLADFVAFMATIREIVALTADRIKFASKIVTMKPPRHPENATLLAAIRSAHRRLIRLVAQWDGTSPPNARRRIKAVADALLRVLRNGNSKSPKK